MIAGTRAGIAGLIIGTLVLLVPVLVAPLPPLGDYPNHLARMWLLSSAEAQRTMAQFYHVQFDTATNVAIDLLALTVGKWAGYVAAGRLSIALSIVLPPLGGALLWWSVHRRVQWWMLSFGLLAWGGTVLSAFLNFQIAIGLALIAAALEPALVRRSLVVQFLVRAIMSVILLVAHPFGLLFYAMLLGALAIGPSPTMHDWAPRARRLMVAACAVAGVLLLFITLTPSLPGAQEHSGLATIPASFAIGFQRFREAPLRKVANLFFALRSYSNRVDGLAALALLAPLMAAFAKKSLRLHLGLMLLSAVLIAAFFVFPGYLLGAGSVDYRFAIMLASTVAAGVAPTLPRLPSMVAAAVLALVFVARTAWIADIWHARQADVVSIAEALEPVPAGASILTVENRPKERSTAPNGRFTSSGENSFRHLPAMAVPWRHAFVPTIFAARGKQPVVDVPPWDALAEPNGGVLADSHAVDRGMIPVFLNAVEGEDYKYRELAARWRDFDYLLVLDADVPDSAGPFSPPADLTLVRDSGFAKLYRIAH